MKFKYNGQWYDISAPVFDGMPIGTIVEFAGDSTKTPSGWLLCDGSAISRSSYSELFGIIGTAYGTGDGSTTFNLPNYKGRIGVGLDANDTDFDTIGETGGSKYLQAHTHNGLNWIGHINEPITLNSGSTAGGYALPYSAGTNSGQENAIQVNSAGTGNSGNLQPYIVINKIIKVFNVVPLLATAQNEYSESSNDAYSCDFINDLIQSVYEDGNTRGYIKLPNNVAICFGLYNPSTPIVVPAGSYANVNIQLPITMVANKYSVQVTKFQGGSYYSWVSEVPQSFSSNNFNINMWNNNSSNNAEIIGFSWIAIGKCQ